MNCSLGDYGVPSYEDICNFTCNTGYELTGANTRICQSNGSWSGSDVVCINERGNLKASIYHNYITTVGLRLSEHVCATSMLKVFR